MRRCTQDLSTFLRVHPLTITMMIFPEVNIENNTSSFILPHMLYQTYVAVTFLLCSPIVLANCVNRGPTKTLSCLQNSLSGGSFTKVKTDIKLSK